jgi:hypothetical protein
LQANGEATTALPGQNYWIILSAGRKIADQILIPSRYQMLTVVRVFRPVEHTNLKVRTTLVRYPLNATWYN